MTPFVFDEFCGIIAVDGGEALREVKIEVKRNQFGAVWYSVTTHEGDYGLGETLQEALDMLVHDLPREDD
jgi:hypothetical protein